MPRWRLSSNLISACHQVRKNCNFTHFLMDPWNFLLTFAQNLNCETWEKCIWIDIMIKRIFNGWLLASWVSETFFSTKNLNWFLSLLLLAKLSWLPLAYRKKINETIVWASTEVKRSNEIEIHKAKKDSKFNFILISDCLADIHGM